MVVKPSSPRIYVYVYVYVRIRTYVYVYTYVSSRAGRPAVRGYFDDHFRLDLHVHALGINFYEDVMHAP